MAATARPAGRPARPGSSSAGSRGLPAPGSVAAPLRLPAQHGGGGGWEEKEGAQGPRPGGGAQQPRRRAARGHGRRAGVMAGEGGRSRGPGSRLRTPSSKTRPLCPRSRTGGGPSQARGSRAHNTLTCRRGRRTQRAGALRRSGACPAVCI